MRYILIDSSRRIIDPVAAGSYLADVDGVPTMHTLGGVAWPSQVHRGEGLQILEVEDSVGDDYATVVAEYAAGLDAAHRENDAREIVTTAGLTPHGPGPTFPPAPVRYMSHAGNCVQTRPAQAQGEPRGGP